MSKQTFVVAVLFCSVLCATGCSTTRAQLPPQAATSLVDLRHALASGKVHLERTSSALRDLSDNPRYNTRRQIGLFGEEMADLNRESQRIRDINTRMQAKSEEHFASWKSDLKGIENPEIAAAGQERRQETKQTFEAIRAKLEDAKEVLSPYMSNLRDINRYLQQDPTAEGVTSLLPSMRKTLGMQVTAVRQLNGVIEHIDHVTRSVE